MQNDKAPVWGEHTTDIKDNILTGRRYLQTDAGPDTSPLTGNLSDPAASNFVTYKTAKNRYASKLRLWTQTMVQWEFGDKMSLYLPKQILNSTEKSTNKVETLFLETYKMES